MLSLKEGARDHPTLVEPLASSSQRPTDVLSSPQISEITYTYDDQLQTIPLPKCDV